jgi:polysaccharide pyruvyl transferase WcaK-like protein
VNKGSAAQVISTVETLSRLIFDSNFVMVSDIPELDSRLCRRHGIKVVGSIRKKPFSKGTYLLTLFELLGYLVRCMLWSGLHKIGLNVNKLMDEEVLRQYSISDIIVDLSGDSLSDEGSYSIFSLLFILVGIFLKKKIAIYSQSIGPFKKIMVPLARFCLNRADLIVVRENETMSILKKMGVYNPNVYLAAEIAFLLKSAPPEKVHEILLKEGINEKNAYPLVGIGTSALIDRVFESKNESYVAFMAKIADYLVENINAQILLIPHVIIPPKYGPYDDRYIARKIYQTARNKDRINPIEGDYSPEELKGIVGECELFIGARMHSNIAATSMHVPTVALGWSHKYYGIMKMLGQEKYVCDVWTANFSELVSKISDAWHNRDEIRKRLASRTTELEKSALHGAMLVKKLLKPTSPEQPIFGRRTPSTKSE